MTQKEKDWLCKIQMLLLKSDNPYVDDYYYTVSVLTCFVFSVLFKNVSVKGFYNF